MTFKFKPILQDKEVLEYLNYLHEKFIAVPIDKDSNIAAINCTKLYVHDTARGWLIE